MPRKRLLCNHLIWSKCYYFSREDLRVHTSAIYHESDKLVSQKKRDLQLKSITLHKYIHNNFKFINNPKISFQLHNFYEMNN